MPEQKKIYKSLRCILTAEEKLEAGQEIGKESQLHQEAIDTKKEVTTSLAATVELHRVAVNKLGSLLANGYEYRSVECLLTLDHKKDRAIVTRLDTGEVLEDRKLTATERQMQMALEEQAGDAQEMPSNDQEEVIDQEPPYNYGNGQEDGPQDGQEDE